MILALTLALGWETLFKCYDPAVSNPKCDVRCHPHLADIGLSGQLGCDTVLPQFGGIGTTFTINVHRNRCMAVGPIIQQDSTVFIVASTSFDPAPPYAPPLGWLWVGPPLRVWYRTANAKGVASASFPIPSDPTLIGSSVYFQAFVDDAGVCRESTGGRLTFE